VSTHLPPRGQLRNDSHGPQGPGARPGVAGPEALRWIEREIASALAAIRYGSIEIVIQDNRVVQIERREKVRFDPAGKVAP
jgi:hypothetical protein